MEDYKSQNIIFCCVLIISNNQIKVLNQGCVLLLCLTLVFIPVILVYSPQMTSHSCFHSNGFLLVLHIYHAPSNFLAIVEAFASLWNTLPFPDHPNFISDTTS